MPDQQIASSILSNFSWAKIAYSAVLIGGIAVFITELGRLWLDTKLHIGTFQVYESGEEKPAQSNTFALQIINHHRSLVHLFSSQVEHRMGPIYVVPPVPGNAALSASRDTEKSRPVEEKTWWPREVIPIAEPKSALSEIELSVQGINVKQILTKLRQWISTPNEINGSIEKQGNLIRGIAVWPKGPSRAKGAYIDGQLLEIEGQTDASAAAFQIACSLIWAQAAIHQQDLAYTRRQDFCNWALAWSTFISLRGKSGSVTGLEKNDVEALKQLRIFLTRMVDRGASYPEIYRLRADLIDLLPSEDKSDEDLAHAQKDRTYYAINTDPQKRKLPVELANLIALAEARPAIPLSEGKLAETPSDTWKSVLYPHMNNIESAAKATGFGRLYRKDSDQVSRQIGFFNGFAIAPGIIATVGFGLDEADRFKKGGLPRKIEDDLTGYFSFGDKITDERPNEATDIDEVLYFFEGETPGVSFALLRLKDHDASVHPPLVFDLSRNAKTSPVGRYVFTVGYPAFDPRLPLPFTDALLGKTALIKRLMPGRIVQLSESDTSTAASGLAVRVITSDLSTLGGTGGGPLVDLRTGMVAGLHYGGQWKQGMGKFAYATMFEDLMANKDLPNSVREEVENWQVPRQIKN